MPEDYSILVEDLKKRLSQLEMRLGSSANEVLLSAYIQGREDLRSFRDTLFQIYSFMATTTVGLVALATEYPRLVLAIPIPLIVIFITSIAYIPWRGDLIRVTANIERRLGIPFECAHEVQTFEKTRTRGLVPVPFANVRILLACLIAILLLFVFYLATLRLLPN